MTEQDYVFGATEEGFENERLALLEKLYDPATHQFVAAHRNGVLCVDGRRATFDHLASINPLVLAR